MKTPRYIGGLLLLIFVAFPAFSAPLTPKQIDEIQVMRDDMGRPSIVTFGSHVFQLIYAGPGAAAASTIVNEKGEVFTAEQMRALLPKQSAMTPEEATRHFEEHEAMWRRNFPQRNLAPRTKSGIAKYLSWNQVSCEQMCDMIYDGDMIVCAAFFEDPAVMLACMAIVTMNKYTCKLNCSPPPPDGGGGGGGGGGGDGTGLFSGSSSGPFPGPRNASGLRGHPATAP